LQIAGESDSESVVESVAAAGRQAEAVLDDRFNGMTRRDVTTGLDLKPPSYYAEELVKSLQEIIGGEFEGCIRCM